MRQAIELAQQGHYGASPNPMVGALVLVSWIGFGTRIRHHNPAPLV